MSESANQRESESDVLSQSSGKIDTEVDPEPKKGSGSDPSQKLPDPEEKLPDPEEKKTFSG